MAATSALSNGATKAGTPLVPLPLTDPSAVSGQDEYDAQLALNLDTSSGAKKRKFAHTSEAQRRSMVEWLEHPGNFQLLTAPKESVASKIAANGKKVKKTDGFRALTQHVNATTHANWTMEITKSRYESFMTTYRKVKAQTEQAGLVLTDNDQARGIKDIPQKLNALCVYFDRIDALFDPKPGQAPRIENASEQPTTATAERGIKEAHIADSSFTLAAALAEDIADKNAPVPGPEDDDVHIKKRVKHQEETTVQLETATPTAKPLDASVSDPIALQQLAMERERLDLLQEQLSMQKRELDLRERELRQQDDDRRRVIQTDIAAKLIEAGRSASEIKEVLEVILSSAHK